MGNLEADSYDLWSIDNEWWLIWLASITSPFIVSQCNNSMSVEIAQSNFKLKYSGLAVNPN